MTRRTGTLKCHTIFHNVPSLVLKFPRSFILFIVYALTDKPLNNILNNGIYLIMANNLLSLIYFKLIQLTIYLISKLIFYKNLIILKYHELINCYVLYLRFFLFFLIIIIIIIYTSKMINIYIANKIFKLILHLIKSDMPIKHY